MPDTDRLRKTAAAFPDEPGVYIMKDGEGEAIYIGKAGSLKKRVASYFRDRGLDPKTRALMSFVRDIEYIVTASEVEALILESALIRSRAPKFNIQKKDDKRYPYIAVTFDEDYPRVVFTRTVREGDTRYFGPYTDARAARKTVSLINAIFKLKTCTKSVPVPAHERPCMNYQIRRCSGVCRGLMSREEYRQIVEQAVQFLEGRIEPVISALTAMMNRFSEARAYEKAAEIRDMIFDIQKISESQHVHIPVGMDRDVIGVSRRGDEAIVLLFEFRRGILLGRKIAVYRNAEYATSGEVLAAFIADHYRTADVPSRIVTEIEVPDRQLLETYLTSRAAAAVTIRKPETDHDRGAVGLVRKNIDLIAAEREASKEADNALAGMEDIARLLGMSDPPRRMECFDVSNIQGRDAVASMVSFRDGRPDKSGYRRYRIRGSASSDDPGMIREVVERRLRRIAEEGLDMPDLIVVDGGATQLAAALEAARTVGASCRIIALAKQNEEVYRDPHMPPTRLEPGSPAFRILTFMRDEAHRFAVSYHRMLRGKRAAASVLDGAPVSPRAASALLKHFKSIDAIRRARLDELTSVPGIGEKTAKALQEFFNSR